MRRTLPVVALVGLAACKVVDAPDNLEELMVFGFEHFEDDNAILADMFEELVPLVDAQTEALGEGYRINTLSTENLEDAGIPAPNVDDIMGAMGQADYRHGMDDVLFGVTLPDKTQAYDNYVAYEVTEDTDLPCFLAADCVDYELSVSQTVDVSLLGESTQLIDQVYRRLEASDGTPFVMSRVLSPTGVDFNTNIVAIDQQYQLIVLYPQGQGTRRVEAFWVEGRVIGLDIPDSVAVDNFARSVGDQAERVDEFLDTQ
ncbi:MAG: hypothetical protein EP330_18000 [Deltaproteobacteria bacterium]|nr:MAG: hypothetical protein EP330_18000 [Deltaproteobacteria bacterium]